MTPEQWQHIKPILAAALELDAARRATFLREACADASLRKEIQSIIAAHELGGKDFLDRAALPASLETAADARITLSKGTRLGDFEIVCLLGAGGMGEVYRARDRRLEREVAIKVLPQFASLDLERLHRFEQEAKAAAALNHPNILAVFHMGTYKDAPYLVSELLEGETLRALVNRGPISPKRAIDFAVQIARGLASTHEKGIVHRDLKPENLFVTRDGRIKILDFGLAKLMRFDGETQCTEQTLGTQPGAVLGTVGYMAPEQVRGLAADHRSDIFAFGAILYEMLTGQRAFQKPTSAETMSAILNEDPPLVSQITPSIPPALDRAVHRCLEKSPEQRFQSASDLAFGLDLSSDSGRESTRTVPSPKPHLNRKVLTSITILVVALIVVGALRWWPKKSAVLSAKDTIVLSDFDNKTGEPVFDQALNQALSIQIEQSPFLEVLSDRKISDTLKLMGRTPGERVTPEVAKEICIRSGSKVFLQGAISSLGSEYLLGLRAIACVTGDKLAETQGEAPNKEGVLKILSAMASDMRAKLGESIASVQQFNVAPEVATPSLEALKAYSLARTTVRTQNALDAIPLLKRSVELDANFARAYLSLGKLYANMGDASLAADSISKAYALRDRASEVERYEITAEYYSLVTGDLEKAIETFDEWIRVYPRMGVAVANRGVMYNKLGQYTKALEGFQAAQALQPEYTVLAGTSIASANISLDRLNDAKSALDALRQAGIDPEVAWDLWYRIAFLRNDAEEMNRQLGVGLDRPKSKSDALVLQANTQAYHGHLTKARELTRRAAALQRDAGFPETAARNQATVALGDAESGYSAAAKEEALSALAQGSGRTAKPRVALAFALLGDLPRSKALVKDLEKEYPSDTILNGYWLPTIKAAIQTSQGQPSEAVSLLEPAVEFELAYAGALYPAYLRGRAYLVAQNGAAAATEFQKILDHPGIVFNDPVGALARLQIGRSYAVQGDTAKARAAYQDFLTLWKDADPDIPILKEAKAEYAKF